MPRQPRFYYPGAVLHVIQRGNDRGDVFTCSNDRRFYLDFLRGASCKHKLQVHAYVLMSNHVHLLVSPQQPHALASTMQALGRSYVGRFNSVHGRTGTLWEGRYRATPVDTEHYLFACYRYIELNPVRAGIALFPHEYRWSSHRANACGDDDAIVTPHASFVALAASMEGRRAAYRAMFEEPLSQVAIDAIRDATHFEWALGEDAFRAKVETLTGRRCARLPTGPRRGDSSGSFVSDPKLVSESRL
jgi:putative transposase